MIVDVKRSDEVIKDIRLSLNLIVNDLRRLTDDIKCLSEFLEPLERKEREENGNDRNWFLSGGNNNTDNDSSSEGE